MMLVMTSMPCKYNDIHACDDSFGCQLRLQSVLGKPPFTARLCGEVGCICPFPYLFFNVYFF